MIFKIGRKYILNTYIYYLYANNYYLLKYLVLTLNTNLNYGIE